MLVMVEYVFVLTFPDFRKKVSFKTFKTQLSYISDLASVHPCCLAMFLEWKKVRSKSSILFLLQFVLSVLVRISR